MPWPLYPPNPKNNHSTYWLGGWVDLTATLDFWRRENSLARMGIQTLGCPACSLDAVVTILP